MSSHPNITTDDGSLLEDLSKIGINSLLEIYQTEPLAPREIIAHVGPTNTGKTWQAMQELQRAQTGAYLAPLRLLAHEGYETLQNAGIACNLVTGEERMTTEGATHTSSTIEMHAFQKHHEVVLIDEVQLLRDESRGWAWTRALVASNAERVIVTGSADIVPLLKHIVALTGDTLKIRHFKRTCSLVVEDKILRIEDLQPGDALVAFSRNNVLDWKEVIAKRGKQVSVIYGALNPDVRRIEAQRYRDGETSVLVATDAIGLGLNLPIRRIIFTATEKYDGKKRRRLSPSEIRQIAGRAGRGIDNVGYVGATTSKRDLKYLKDVLAVEYKPNKSTLIRIAPEWHTIEKIFTETDATTFADALKVFQQIVDNTQGFAYDLNSETYAMLTVLEKRKRDAYTQYRHVGLPLNVNNPQDRKVFKTWQDRIDHKKACRPPDINACKPTTSFNKAYLDQQETLARHLSAYCWLARKFPDDYPRADEARYAITIASANISTALRKGRIVRRCESCDVSLKLLHPYNRCHHCMDRFS